MHKYTLRELVMTAGSLEPIAVTEYARGICELIARLMYQSDLGEGVVDNFQLLTQLICVEPKES